MKLYAVFDTNVLVSSLLTKNPDSATAKVVNAIYSGEMLPVYSREIIEEYEAVLSRPRFPFSADAVSRLIQMIRQYGLEVTPTPTGEILPDMDDLVFYEVVMEKRDDNAYLITGNIKHFPKREYIVTPSEMMEILGEKRNIT